MAPNNMIHLDHYYNSLKEVKQDDYYASINSANRRQEEEPKTFGQSLKDLFFPKEKSKRRIIKIRKPQLESHQTTLKPYFTTLSTLKDKMSYSKYDTLSLNSFPYVFQRPIKAPSSR